MLTLTWQKGGAKSALKAFLSRLRALRSWVSHSILITGSDLRAGESGTAFDSALVKLRRVSDCELGSSREFDGALQVRPRAAKRDLRPVQNRIATSSEPISRHRPGTSASIRCRGCQYPSSCSA